MKKPITLLAAAALGCGIAMAEGYQVNTLSARQLGMGHTGIGMRLGAESMYFNPAGLTGLDKTLEIGGSVTAIMPSATATTLVGGKEKSYETDCNASTPVNFNAAFSIFPNLKAGVSFYTPYGSSINWTRDWAGSVLSQDVNLKVFTVQPTIAWAITPKLSVGAGAMISWGSVDLNKGLVSASTADKMLGLLQGLGQLPAGTPPFGETSPASVNLTGTAQTAVGFNVGALYEFNDKWSVGASYRSQMKMKVKAGDASVSYANDLAQGLLSESLDIINAANFKAEMPCPWVFGLGVTYKPVKGLVLAADARLTGWKAYKTLDIEFLNPSLESYNQHIAKNYHNSWTYSVGAQYAFTKRLDGRLGLMIDTTPVSKTHYNPETPGMTKIEPTLGLSFRPLPDLSVDIAFMYIHGTGVKGASCSYPDLLGARLPSTISGMMQAQGIPAAAADAAAAAMCGNAGITASQTFTADYKLHAFAPSIGISYRF